MCKLKITLLIVIFALGTVMAATDTGQSMTSGTSGMTAKTDVLKSANKIMGADVKGSGGEEIGTVKELIVDQGQDNVQYVILSVDDMLHPVPFTAFKCPAGEADTHADANVGTERTHLMLNMTKDQVHSAPSIESIDDTTNLSSPTMKQKIDSFYSKQMKESEGAWNKMKSEVKERMPSSLKGESATQAEGQLKLIKGSDIIGMDVKGLNDEDLAEIKDLVIDTRKGNIAYGLLGYGGVLGVKERQSAVPWSAISIQPDNKVAKLDATTEKLDRAALTEGRISQLNQRQFAQRIHEVFGVEPYWQVYGFEAPSEESGTMQRDTQQRDYQRDIQQDTQKQIERDAEKRMEKGTEGYN
ncbi:MAG: hypothetical protein A2Y12_09930 [Planctomycetes bacterium GWF2_42_9]|nr:MAG: hypothetical protein A2Y12_09930 [Planctomycetes bacterium GWF2_42_9]